MDDMDDLDMFSFGVVIGVVGDRLTLSEYDFALDADVEAVYHVPPDAEFGNVASLADLRPGDNVVVDYQPHDDRRIVTTLVREEKDDEPVDVEYYGDA